MWNNGYWNRSEPVVTSEDQNRKEVRYKTTKEGSSQTVEGFDSGNTSVEWEAHGGLREVTL
jgi:hypothetical protein